MANTDHPFVTMTQKVLGGDYQLIFRIDGYQIKRGTGTDDFDKAKRYAIALSKIIVSKCVGDPPPETPDIVLTMLGLEPRIKKIATATNETWEEIITQFMSGATERETILKRLKKSGAFIQAVQRIFDEAKQLKTRIEGLERDLSGSRANERQLREKVDAYDALRVKEGKKVARAFENKSLRQAIDDYMNPDSGGTGAGERFRPTIEMMLNGFAEAVGATTPILNIPTEGIVGYLKKRKEQNSVGYCRQEATYLCAMLTHQSSGIYPIEDVKTWIEKDLMKESKGDDDWYWLEPAQVAELMKKANSKDDASAQYWADAMTVQHNLALRPEEIIMIQTAKVVRGDDGTISHVRLTPIHENGVLIRRLKTRNSEASIPVTSAAAKQAVERRLAAGHRLLFPRIPDECGCRKPNWNAYNRMAGKAGKGKEQKRNEKRIKFEADHKLWQERMWCRFYLRHLRSAARMVVGIDIDRLDSRTLRRTRGRDIVVATRSIYEAAKLLRDDPKTIERHYAILRPMDVNVG